MKTYWYNRVANFGDALAPALLDLFGIPYTWAPPADAELVTIGSVLQSLPRGYAGSILGAGLIAADRRADVGRARVLAVRGPLTRDALELPRGTFLADPGILAPMLLRGRTIETRDDVAVAPHYIDAELAGRYPRARPIDVGADPVTVLEAIAASRLVITSSLHVAIAADALGVLHVVEPHRRVVGGLFKFSDYAAALGATLEPGLARLTDRAIMAERAAELRAYYVSLAAERSVAA